MSLSCSLPLKLSSCFRLSHLHSVALSTRVAALYGLILVGRRCFILKQQKRKHSVFLLMLVAFKLFISLNLIFLETLTEMGFSSQVAICYCCAFIFVCRPHTNLSLRASIQPITEFTFLISVESAFSFVFRPRDGWKMSQNTPSMLTGYYWFYVQITPNNVGTTLMEKSKSSLYLIDTALIIKGGIISLSGFSPRVNSWAPLSCSLSFSHWSYWHVKKMSSMIH